MLTGKQTFYKRDATNTLASLIAHKLVAVYL